MNNKRARPKEAAGAKKKKVRGTAVKVNQDPSSPNALSKMQDFIPGVGGEFFKTIFYCLVLNLELSLNCDPNSLLTPFWQILITRPPLLVTNITCTQCDKRMVPMNSTSNYLPFLVLFFTAWLLLCRCDFSASIQRLTWRTHGGPSTLT